METNIEGIYAIGDITGKAQLAHVASAQGMVAAANAAGIGSRMDYTVIPSCIYTTPEVAAVGLSEADARKNGHGIKVGRFPVNANGKSMIMGESEGLVKIVADEKSGVILGAHFMAPRATDMLPELSVAIQKKLTIDEIANVIHPHPTVSEIIMEAAHDVDGHCIHVAPRKK
jgi:dihydrolipoamide dehydrogenase